MEDMVLDHAARAGSRMVAYAIVGRLVRRSPVWVRKLLGRQDVGVSADTFLAVHEAYQAHCARIENIAAARSERAKKLMEEAHAVRARVGRQPVRDGG